LRSVSFHNVARFFKGKYARLTFRIHAWR